MRLLAALSIAALLTACGKPLPSEKASYAGPWKAAEMSLLITQDGSVKYERIEGNGTKSLSAPLKGFDGDNFSAGVGPMTTTFVVTATTHPVGELTKMTVDGVELTREP